MEPTARASVATPWAESVDSHRMNDPVVVIVASGGPTNLQRCLEAVEKSSAEKPSRVIVVERVAATAALPPWVERLTVQHDEGFASSANAGISHAQRDGRVDIVLLHPNASPRSGWLATLGSIADRRRDAGVVTSPASADRSHSEGPGGPYAIVMIRRTALREVAPLERLLDERGSIDDLCARVRAAGFAVVAVEGDVWGVAPLPGRGLAADWARARARVLLHLKAPDRPLRQSVRALPRFTCAAALRDVRARRLRRAILHWPAALSCLPLLGQIRASRASTPGGPQRAPRSTGTTEFFRNPAQLAVLLEQLPAQPRVLVLACSTGQEPYSLAIAALAAGRSDVSIRAADVDRASLATARRAVYPPESVQRAADAGVDIAPFIERVDETSIRLTQDVRARVSFEVLDVLDAAQLPAPGSWDLVLCQNLLVHLDDAQRRDALEHVSQLPRRGGLLAVAGAWPGAGELLCRDAYTAVADHARAIHDGWTLRRADHDRATAAGQAPPHWALGAWPEELTERDALLRCGSLFRRTRVR